MAQKGCGSQVDEDRFGQGGRRTKLDQVVRTVDGSEIQNNHLGWC